jgi:hypothetical protein
MSTTAIFAIAGSALHADLIVTALRRVGLSTQGISVLYPGHVRPESALFWIEGATPLALSAERGIAMVSGRLRYVLDRHQEKTERPSVAAGLRTLGLTEEQSLAFETALFEDRVVLCIEAADESEVALVFHLLHHIGAEKMVLTEQPHPGMPKPVRRQRPPVPAKAKLSLSVA